MGNLRLGRRKDQVVVICDNKLGEEIRLHIVGFNSSRNEYNLSITASDRYSIDREEIYIKKKLGEKLDGNVEISGNK